MIEWQRTRFLKDGYGIAFPGLKVKESLHVAGEARGYLLVEASNVSQIHAALTVWSDVLDITCRAVLSDAEAAAALKA